MSEFIYKKQEPEIKDGFEGDASFGDFTDGAEFEIEIIEPVLTAEDERQIRIFTKAIKNIDKCEKAIAGENIGFGFA